MPFGLSTAPYIFTKCVRPLQKYWRLQGVKIAICLDDGLVIENDYGVCKMLSSRIKEDLRRVGFVANAEILFKASFGLDSVGIPLMVQSVLRSIG